MTYVSDNAIIILTARDTAEQPDSPDGAGVKGENVKMANEVIKQYYEWDETGEAFGVSISYDAGENCGPVAGAKLTGGQLRDINGQMLVWFDNAAAKAVAGKPIGLRYDNKPDLAALVDEYKRLEAEKQAKRDARWAIKKAEQDAIDNPLLEAMEIKVTSLREQIPSDHIEVKVTQTGDLDGDPILEYEADGVKLRWSDVNVVGWASAIRPGALGAFAQVCIASISRDQLAEIRSAQADDAVKKSEKNAARQKELTETVIPPSALEAYNYYHGDSDLAWEKEDESSWAIIEKWTPYIEAQHGIAPRKLQRMISESAREESYGINEG